MYCVDEISMDFDEVIEYIAQKKGKDNNEDYKEYLAEKLDYMIYGDIKIIGGVVVKCYES